MKWSVGTLSDGAVSSAGFSKGFTVKDTRSTG